MSTRRVMAALALVSLPALLALAVTSLVANFPAALLPLACVALAPVAAWRGLVRRGLARALGAGLAMAALAGAVVLLFVDGLALEGVLIAAGMALLFGASREALRARVALAPAPAPRRPVLFMNPRSGGGKATRFELASEAGARGIRAIELTPGSDLRQLVLDAVADGADALAMAGGDGSQAVVAAMAAERDLPYACVPAGTRNHFALDLGVDRDDVVGALDAFVDGGERRVDLATVNGRVFVNNVSLGLYAEAVQRPGYREAKLRTLLEFVPDAMGPGGEQPKLRWQSAAGHEHLSGGAILVSNNRYRLGHAVASGTRPRMDAGMLGITVMAGAGERGARSRILARPWREWSAPSFEVASEHPVPAGIDGEALVLDPPLRFEILPGTLRVRIAQAHPGASPSAAIPDSPWETALTLVRIAAGREEPRSA